MADTIAYTPEEVAKILKISRFTVYEMIKRGDLAAYHIGRKVRIEAADLDIYIRRAKGVAQAAGPQAKQAEAGPFYGHEGLVICGQDVILDVLTRHLERKMPHVRFLRNYIGSIDGLLALYRGTANVVTAHLWDSDTDTYNLPYVRRLLPGHRAIIVNLVYRNAGFFVAKGNPKGITGWPDLAKPGVRFVNRECGSGARVLVDEKLRALGIDPAAIAGYNWEEMSHLAVASFVARGEADVGVGTEKAALQVKDIDFIPIQKECYDMVIRREDVDKPHFQMLLTVLRSSAFQAEVVGMGGYDIARMGEITMET